MEYRMISGVLTTPLRRIPVAAGDVMHAMKSSDPGFVGFGEAYFSTIHSGQIKGWKKHSRMTLNFVVPIGRVRVVLYDDRSSSISFKKYMEVCLSLNEYCRLTIPPGIWVAFQGADPHTSMMLNLASIPHDPEESEQCPLEKINYSWPAVTKSTNEFELD